MAVVEQGEKGAAERSASLSQAVRRGCVQRDPAVCSARERQGEPGKTEGPRSGRAGRAARGCSPFGLWVEAGSRDPGRVGPEVGPWFRGGTGVQPGRIFDELPARSWKSRFTYFEA